MNVNRNKLIDLRHPHLIPGRLRHYALEIYDTLTRYPSVNKNLQIIYNILPIIEAELAKEPLSSDLFAATNADPRKREGLIALRDGRDNWQTIRNPSPYGMSDGRPILSCGKDHYNYFFIYTSDNKLEYSDALHALISHYDIAIECEIDREFTFVFPSHPPCVLDTGDVQKPHGGISFSRYEVDSLNGYFEKSQSFPKKGGWDLFNCHLLKDFQDGMNLRPVFVAESVMAAKDLQRNIWLNYLHFSLCQLIDALKRDGMSISEDDLHDKEPISNGTGGYIVLNKPRDNPKDRNDCLYNLVQYMKITPYNNSYPLGDAIWVAPVGGYTVPGWTDWSPLAERDVYIFKFGEQNDQKTLRELIELYSNLPRSEDYKVSFVIFPEKRSTDVSANHIEVIGPEDLFTKVDLAGIDIPESLLNEYNKYLRDSRKNACHSRYILEPVLRRSSWALLTGEEGVGKSYFAMALGMAIASNGKLFGEWKVRNKGGKVMYIADDEMSEEILSERLKVLRKMYRRHDNFIVRTVQHLDLLNGGKERIEDLINKAVSNGDQQQPVKVLFLDHLLKLSDTVGDQREKWPKIREWIEVLNQKGIAVILLHHEYGGGKMLGTRLIGNDAPVRIHLERINDPDREHLTVNLSVPKNRGGKDQPQAAKLTLNLGANPRWIQNGDCCNDKLIWKGLNLEERLRQIAELRKTHTVKSIAEKYGVSKSSIEKLISELKERQ